MKEWLRKIIKLIAVEVLKRDAEIVFAVNEAINEIYDNLAELGDGSALLTYQDTSFKSDGSIEQVNDNTRTTTSFGYDSKGNRQITEVTKDLKTGKIKSTKVTTITEDVNTKLKTVKEEWVR